MHNYSQASVLWFSGRLQTYLRSIHEIIHITNLATV